MRRARKMWTEIAAHLKEAQRSGSQLPDRSELLCPHAVA